eukprot:8942333-Alexandrium_andersonii.AAC.1
MCIRDRRLLPDLPATPFLRNPHEQLNALAQHGQHGLVPDHGRVESLPQELSNELGPAVEQLVGNAVCPGRGPASAQDGRL